MNKNSSAKGKKDITTRDVVVHMQHMEQRLSKKIDGNTNSVNQLKNRMDTLEEHLTKRMDALEEDLTATIKDSIDIRKYVGMPLPEDA